MVGWDRGADRASNDADISSIPPIIPYGGFFPSTAGGLAYQTRPSRHVNQLKPAPGMRWPTTGLSSPFVHLVIASVIPHCVGPRTPWGSIDG